MEVFHGTNAISAASIIGPPNAIDITKGRGELGRGFYVGSEPALAAAMAKGRHPSSPAVLQISFPVEDFLVLHIKIVKRAERLRLIWNRLIKNNETTTYQFNADVVTAPFATIGFAHQYKFESLRAESFLNGCTIKKIL